MTTTHTPNYAQVAAHATTDELSLVITLNYDMITDHIHGTTELTDAELTDASLIHQAATDELHTRALTIHTSRPHLTTTRAAARHLATLIRQHRMDGQDIHDMGHDENNSLGLVDRHGYPEVYAFLLTACDTFNVDGYGLLQTATVDILGW